MRLTILCVRFVSSVLAACLLVFPQPGHAGSISISPITIEVSAKARASAVTLRNLGDDPANVQVRVFLWRQAAGKDELIETRDVVVSPPFATIAPRSEQLLRVIRVSKRPVEAEESYRVLVDELPVHSPNADQNVNLVLRSSIPVFISGGSKSHSLPLDWVIDKHRNKLRLTVTNASGRHIRLSALALSTDEGQRLHFEKGLAGYVLAHSSMTWNIAGTPAKRAARGSRILISAQSNEGPVRGEAVIRIGQ